jgi:hypothetical protein
MAEFSVLLFYTIIPLLILSIPFVVVVGLFIAQMARNRRYRRVVRMDDGLTFFVEPGGNIVIKPRGWFTRIAFVAYGAIIAVIILPYPFIASTLFSFREVVTAFLADGVVVVFLVYSVAYLRYRPTHIDTAKNLIQTGNVGARREIPFQSVSSVQLQDATTLVHDAITYLRYGLLGPLGQRHLIRLVLVDRTEPLIGSITVGVWALGNRKKQPAEIQSLIEKTVLAGGI